MKYVCFAVNITYIPCLERCIKGLLSRISKPEELQLVILMNQDVPKENHKDLCEIIASYNAPGPLIYYPELMFKMDFRTENVRDLPSAGSFTTFYRLFLPKLLKDVGVCLYMDTDIAILDDLTDLLDIDLEDYYIAGVPDRLCLDAAFDEHTTLYGIKPAHYVNAGMILMNLKAIRRDGISEEFEEMGRTKALRFLDQDILNYSCKGNVKILQKKYNVFPGDCEAELEILRSKAPECIHLLDSDAVINPSIIHYVGPRKPWNNTEVEYADRYFEM